MIRAGRSSLAIIIGLVLVLVATSEGQPISFSLSPADVEIAVSPGSDGSAPLYVINRSPQTLSFRAGVGDLPSVAGSMSATAFTTVTPSVFNIEPERMIALRTAVSIPRDARGGKYAGIVVSTSISGPNREEGASAILLPSIMARLAVRIKGTEIISAGIRSIGARSTEDGGATVRIVFANRGNVHVWLQGEVAGLDPDGRKIKTVPIPSGLVLPGSNREFELIMGSLPRPCTLRATIDYGADVLSVGEVQLK